MHEFSLLYINFQIIVQAHILALQEEQKENRKLCGRCYNKKYADYICVDAMGNLLKPDYLSNSFQIILQNYHLRRIHFHDLRHSCASLLLANGVPMKKETVSNDSLKEKIEELLTPYPDPMSRNDFRIVCHI